ncbi:MAG: DUF6273 domain-containing protein [Tepidanaerobacteraceae bacterium]|jgi:co-chaperonin GroES (HSP10)|nr:DUF6273 domain-containing protein [Tepidanaerobacteraceae bacterium]
MILPEWKKVIRRTAGSIIVLVAISCCFFGNLAKADDIQKTVETGDYVLFGSYDRQPILWRAIDKDENGRLLLWSEYIISLKPFDAGGDKHREISRREGGSNNWEYSNIRQWLNSEEQVIQWKQNPPSRENLWNGNNAYDAESGFLSDRNFTSFEKELIQETEHKVLLSYLDDGMKDPKSSSLKHIYQAKIDKAVQNYDNARYQIVKDKVFLLSVKEVKQYVADRGWEYRKKPTEQAVSKSTLKFAGLGEEQYWNAWLRTPANGSGQGVRFITADGLISNTFACSVSGGVAPAVMVDFGKVEIGSGTGSREDPYTLKERHAISLREGDYVLFGAYKGEKLLWRVINVDNEGNPLLWSEYAIGKKAFDAAESGIIRSQGGTYSLDLQRQKWGSNRWENSNIREWLNSADQKVNWTTQPPKANALWKGSNPYDEEPGFLAGFTQRERELLKPITHRVLMAEADQSAKNGGVEDHRYRYGKPNEALQNYADARYQNITDTVFLLSLQELKEYVWDRGWECKKGWANKPAEYVDYWLRTPYTDRNALDFTTTEVRFLHKNGNVSATFAAQSEVAVVPAVVLDAKKLRSLKGCGNLEKPYTVE